MAFAPTATAITPPLPARREEPLVIAHRGASGYRPEHTLAAYRLAIRLGADFVEPDLVPTADGVLVARHENEISGTTDVAHHPEFAPRRTTRVVDGRPVTGWFVEDFTLAELRTLRARERLPRLRPASSRHDGRYGVPTFAEVLDLVAEEGRRRGEVVGVYPELKHPTYFAAHGLAPEPALAAALAAAGLDRPNASVFVQSFEPACLRRLASLVRVPLVQLVARSGAPYDHVVAGDRRTVRDLLTPLGLREISTYAVAVGTDKHHVIPRSTTGDLLEPTSLVGDAHAAGLQVHAYTFRNERQWLPTSCHAGGDPAPNSRGDALAEYHAFFRAGVDAVFTDHPDTALAARRELGRTSQPQRQPVGTT
ncbi:MAG: glycerophosphodiester phosphodiesterase [Actinomycetota bacterium]|nr:glycerophosphodiester phosphodiesterase [Actinomycetota bacterium]